MSADRQQERPVDVAVAVLTRPDGSVLLAQRPSGKVYAGYWEFPGGKVEPGEAVAAALEREIREELGVEIERAYPWITQVFTYPHAAVRLHFFRVRAWKGELVAHEHEGLHWHEPRAGAPSVSPVLPANGPVLRALTLPEEYALSQAAELGEARWLERLRARLEEGLRLIQLREPTYSAGEMERLSAKVLEVARPAGARVLVNSDAALARKLGTDGIHLTAGLLGKLTARPDLAWIGASCHSAGEIRAAERLGADFAVLGPVKATPTHPNARTLGWGGFEAEARGAGLPVYALGGMVRSDLETAWAHGAHGIAMLRGAWA